MFVPSDFPFMILEPVGFRMKIHDGCVAAQEITLHQRCYSIAETVDKLESLCAEFFRYRARHSLNDAPTLLYFIGSHEVMKTHHSLREIHGCGGYESDIA
jgi:hypothetical protein